MDTNIPFEGPRISVTARIDPSEGFTAFVNQTAPPTGDQTLSTLTLPEAQVILYSSSEAFFVNSQGDGFFSLTNIPISESDSFRLEIIAPNLDTLKSKWVIIPPGIEDPFLEEIIELDTIVPDPFTYNRVRLNFSGIDPPGDNKYLIEVTHNVNFSSTLFFDFFADFDSESCEVFNFNSIFFPDICFTNEAWEFTLVPDLFLFTFGGQRLEFEDYIFVVRSIDENYFNYQLDRLNLDDLRGIILEPRASVTNVTGGEGLFVASNSFRRVLARP
ncbi:DUF4249 family protein [Neolewinella agarilytica]|uniref:DUF4249 family protein n=1 Tax=Neolewinella agarilytica TaxID=478744 RepID=UPI001FE067C1|nr:DUF4249 family protein [Neolewinella agarilytica]